MLLFILDDLFGILFSLGISFGIILIILGLLQAFFWKLAFYMNIVIGLIITITITYIASTAVNAINDMLGGLLPNPTLGIFLVLLIFTLLAAFLGAILAVLEGFIWTSLGILVILFASVPSMLFHIPESLIITVGGGAVLVGFAAYMGNYLDIWILKITPKLGTKTLRKAYTKDGGVSTCGSLLTKDVYDVIGQLAKLRAKLSAGEITRPQFQQEALKLVDLLKNHRGKLTSQLSVLEEELKLAAVETEPSKLFVLTAGDLNLFEERVRSMNDNDLLVSIRQQEYMLSRINSEYTRKKEHLDATYITSREYFEKRLNLLKGIKHARKLDTNK